MEKVREKNKYKNKRYYGKSEKEIPYIRSSGLNCEGGVNGIFTGRCCAETDGDGRAEESGAACGAESGANVDTRAGKRSEDAVGATSSASSTDATTDEASKSDGEATKSDAGVAQPNVGQPEEGCDDNGFSFNIMFRDHAEDADPYRDGNTVAVADGMGGAGACLLKIDEATVKKIGKIVTAAVEVQGFGKNIGESDCRNGYAADSFARSWRKYVEYLRNAYGERDCRATHAAVASRIVMAVFGGMVESCRASDCKILSEEFAERFHRAAVGALRETTVKLGISLPENDLSHASILPSTFVAASVDNGSADSRIVSVCWAGDSRCYFMDGNGLRILSEDEEDKSGGLTNFMTGGKRSVSLNYAKFILDDDTPFAVFVCSDGLFDMLGDDSVFGLAGKMRTAFAESGNMTEVGIRLRAQCEPRVGDDCSVALVSFGGFEAVRSAVMALGDKFAGLEEEKDRLEYDIRYAENPAAVENLCAIMQNRCRSNAVEIAERILSMGKRADGKNLLEKLLGLVEPVHDSSREAVAALRGADIVFRKKDGFSEVVPPLTERLRIYLLCADEDTESVGFGGTGDNGVGEAVLAVMKAVLRVMNDSGADYSIDMHMPADDGETLAVLVSVLETQPRAVVETLAACGKSVAAGFNTSYAVLYERLLEAAKRAGTETEEIIADFKSRYDGLVRVPKSICRTEMKSD